MIRIVALFLLMLSASLSAEITYPVDVDGSRWAVYRLSTQEIVRHNERWPRADGGPIRNLDADLVPLLEVDEAAPAYDPATQKLQRAAPVVDTDANTHTHGWQVVARSQAEIDADAELAQIKAVYRALRDHTGTSAERINRVETVLAYLLKEQYGAQ